MAKTNGAITRQEEIIDACKDLSTKEIKTRITHAETLLSMYASFNNRALQTIEVAKRDIANCRDMSNTLNDDIAALSSLIRARK